MEIDQMLSHIFSKVIANYKYHSIKNKGFFKVAFITGADMMLRRCDIDKLGFFDSSFFLYFEETELAYRYHSKGKISAFVPEAKIIHLEGGSFSLSKIRSKYFMDGRNRFYKMNYSTFYHIIANLIWYINLFFHFIQNFFTKLKATCKLV